MGFGPARCGVLGAALPESLLRAGWTCAGGAIRVGSDGLAAAIAVLRCGVWRVDSAPAMLVIFGLFWALRRASKYGNSGKVPLDILTRCAQATTVGRSLNHRFKQLSFHRVWNKKPQVRSTFRGELSWFSPQVSTRCAQWARRVPQVIHGVIHSLVCVGESGLIAWVNPVGTGSLVGTWVTYSRCVLTSGVSVVSGA